MITDNESTGPLMVATPTFHVNRALDHLSQAGVTDRNLREAALFFGKELDGVDVHKLWPIADMAEDTQDTEAEVEGDGTE
jgi:hypothetical protein